MPPKKDEHLVIEFHDLQRQYEAKFGLNTILLMQVGMFYEHYGCTINDKHFGKIDEVSSMLNMRFAKKDKSYDLSLENPYMVGFPCVALERHLEVLIENNYTVVIIDQKKDGDNVTRQVKEVISGAMRVDPKDNNKTSSTNQFVGLYLQTQNKNLEIKTAKDCENVLIAVGIACIDIATGRNIVCETYSENNNQFHAIQEIYRFLSTQMPKQILINIDFIEQTYQKTYETFLRQVLQLDKYDIVLLKFNKLLKPLHTLPYQKQFFNKIFTRREPTRCNDIITHLELDQQQYGRLAYMLLLQHCYDHNPELVKNIQPPTISWMQAADHLQLTHNAIQQLHLLPSIDKVNSKKAWTSLFEVLDKTKTPMGRRYLRNVLLNPLNDVETLNFFYNATDELLDSQEFLVLIEKKLTLLPDLEKYQRKLSMLKIKPGELDRLFLGYKTVGDLYDLINRTPYDYLKALLYEGDDLKSFNDAVRLFYTTFDYELLAQADYVNNKIATTKSFVRKGLNAAIDNFQGKIDEEFDKLNKIINHLDGLMGKSRGINIILDWKKISNSDLTDVTDLDEDTIEDDDDTEVGKKVGGSRKISKKAKDSPGKNNLDLPALLTTKAKGEKLKKAKYDKILCGTLKFEAAKAGKVKIVSTVIDKICLDLEVARVAMLDQLTIFYQNILDKLAGGANYVSAINSFVSVLDYTSNNARMSIDNNYYRPVVDEAEGDGPSYLEFKDLRHPLIEKLISSDYVVNDIALGKTNKGSLGALLLGLNSSGKSSLIRAIGLGIIMAQAGMFVAGKLKFKPYNKILTRLTGNDDLLNGHSSFAVEMIELRTIIRGADKHSLVLSDEACRGTETLSGSAIAVTMLETLAERNSSFITSTHLHHLPEIDEVKNLSKNKLRICHLTTNYDESTKLLIFDRKLVDGPGKNTYGIEVAKYLNLDDKFIKKAEKIRKKLANQPEMLLNTKQSRYNKNVYLDSCLLCGKTTNLETHHLEEQHLADGNKMIDGKHKDREANLAALCKTCHQKLHKNKQKLVQRSIGFDNLIYQIVDE